MKIAITLLIALLPAVAMAHPGHGLGNVGHGLDHALWNFIAVVVLSALILAAGKFGKGRD